MQHVGRDQFTIAQPPSIRRDHRTIFGSQILRGQFETFCGLCYQEPAHLRGDILDRGAAVLHRMAAGGVAFVSGKLRIGRDDL